MKQSTINKKSEAIINICADVFYKSLDSQDKVSLLCTALLVSAKGTKHWHESLDLIKRLSPDFYERAIRSENEH